MGTINGSLLQIIKRMLLENYYASGVETKSKTMLDAIENCRFDITAYRIRVSMVPDAVYPVGPRGGGTHGNVYAATAKLGIFKLTPAQEMEIFLKKEELLEVALKNYGLVRT